MYASNFYLTRDRKDRTATLHQTTIVLLSLSFFYVTLIDCFLIIFSCRTVLLKLASIAVLMITLYVEVESRCNKNPENCCQQVKYYCFILLLIDSGIVAMAAEEPD